MVFYLAPIEVVSSCKDDGNVKRENGLLYFPSVSLLTYFLKLSIISTTEACVIGLFSKKLVMVFRSSAVA